VTLIKILLAEDHKIVREGTRQLLAQAQGFQVIGEAEDGEEAVRLAAQLAPDIVVMDIRMPRLTGLEATKRIKAANPRTRVLILSAYENDEYIFPALEAGANGYLLKTVGGQELIRAIENIHAGQTVLDPRVTGKVVGQLTGRQSPAKKPGLRSEEMAESLSARELEVLQAAALGKSNKEIAEALIISAYTVQVHLRNIFGKLGVGSRTEAIAYTLRQGWITLDRKEE
jgi:NarL family two-component system response regulator LiaR